MKNSIMDKIRQKKMPLLNIYVSPREKQLFYDHLKALLDCAKSYDRDRPNYLIFNITPFKISSKLKKDFKDCDITYKYEYEADEETYNPKEDYRDYDRVFIIQEQCGKDISYFKRYLDDGPYNLSVLRYCPPDINRHEIGLYLNIFTRINEDFVM